MSQTALLALVILVSGVYAVRWANRLAPPRSELPLKTTLATVAAGWVVAGDLTTVPVPDGLDLVVAVLGPLYVFGPLAAAALVRGGRTRFATTAVDALYWTPVGRAALRRFLAGIALQRGDLHGAERLAPEGDAVLPVLLAARRRAWDEVLAAAPAEVPATGAQSGAWSVEAARIQALLELDATEEAAERIRVLEVRAEEPDAGPALHAAARLSAARLAAARGRVEETRRRLNPPPEGVPAHELFATLAEAAARARHAAEGDLWTRAFAAAPPPLRARYAERIRAAGGTVPELRPVRPWGTWALTGALLLAYLGQVGLDRFGTAVPTSVGRLDPSWAAAAFLLGVPGAPAADAWWRTLSYAYVHGNLIHIALNAWVLFDVGRMLEGRRHWGDLTAAFVAGTAMGAYLTQVAQAGQVVVLVGASGGVLGVAGALLADVLRGRGAADRQLTRALLQWILLIGVLSVAVPGVSLWGHVGGVVGGLLWGFARQGAPAGAGVSRVAGYLSVSLLVGVAGIVVSNGVGLLR